LDAIDKEKYHPVLIGIDKSGNWLLNDSTRFLLDADNPKLIKLNLSGNPVAMIPQNQGKLSRLTGGDAHASVDVVFPILHGPFGEDGTIQGMLKLANVPFVGASILGSAVGMDKDVMKRLLRDAKLPIGPFITLHAEDPLPDFESVSNQLGLPVFVKPANLGSSVGISKVRDASQYHSAIQDAFDYDRKILIEACIEGREIGNRMFGFRQCQPHCFCSGGDHLHTRILFL